MRRALLLAAAAALLLTGAHRHRAPGAGVRRPPPAPGARAAAASPLPPALRPDAATAQALGQALGLPPGALHAVAAHAQALERPRPEASAVVATAEALKAALFDALAPRHAEAAPAERAAMRELAAALARALPGAAVAAPDAGPFEAGVDYDALARALPRPTAGQDLLAIAGALRAPTGGLGYMRAGGATGATGAPPCADFGRVTGALAGLPGAWAHAPAPLRARLQAPLRDAVVRMGEQADFCGPEADARAAAGLAARALVRLPAFGGPGTAKRLGHNFRSYGLRFGLGANTEGAG